MTPGYYCEDCGVLLTADQYALHDADHTIRKVRWEYVTTIEG
jgi:hypothetical protein